MKPLEFVWVVLIFVPPNSQVDPLLKVFFQQTSSFSAIKWVANSLRNLKLSVFISKSLPQGLLGLIGLGSLGSKHKKIARGRGGYSYKEVIITN